MSDDPNLPDEELDRIAGDPIGGAPAPAPLPDLPGGVPNVPAPEFPVTPNGNSPLRLVPPPPAPVPIPVTPAPAGMAVVKGSRETQETVPSPELQQGFQGGQKTIQDEKKLAADASKTAEDEARIQAEHAAAVEEETRRQNADIAAEQQYQADQQKIRNDKYLADMEAIKSSPAPRGFQDWSGKKKAFGYLSIVLGGLARGATGGVNRGLEQVHKQVEDEYQRQAEGIQQKYKQLAMQHGFNQELEGQERDALARMTARKQLALEDLNNHAKSQLDALGVSKARQAGILAQLGLDAKAAKAQEDYGKIVSTKVTDTMQVRPGGRVGGGPSNALSRLSAFARANPGPENEPGVIAEAERLFPGMKPAQMQALVTAARKASDDAVAKKGSAPPSVYTDMLSGKSLPIDPSRTDTRQHNEAVANLKPINTFLATAHKLLQTAKSPQAPEWSAMFGKNVTGQAGAAAAITRLRSAYAAAKHESVGAQNSEHLEHAIPDPPTWPATKASMDAWRRKIADVVEEMTDLRKEGLANAGVPPEMIEQATPATTSAGRNEKKDPVNTAIDALAEKYGL